MRQVRIPGVAKRALVAFVCAAVLVFNLFALGHARGVVATRHIETAVIAAASGRPCPLPITVHGATICPFSVFSTSAVAEDESLHRRSAPTRMIRLAFADDVLPSSPALGAPFRPPRQG